ncbi:hypothetical protein VIGAN_11004600 [Vigna angularis var. angularis]|uniref:Uncharacterized protein n=1 Tax=Vigna angularis var. angularis TaxID=157739 RepID=A0A0S3T7Y7_PHAAN|nr:hypothetical protein VIGAN_11004600 [Vigna angularis var. angularis]
MDLPGLLALMGIPGLLTHMGLLGLMGIPVLLGLPDLHLHAGLTFEEYMYTQKKKEIFKSKKEIFKSPESAPIRLSTLTDTQRRGAMLAK